MNRFIEHDQDVSVKARKHKMDTKTLKITKDKAWQKAMAAEWGAKMAMKRAENTKPALKRAMEENSRIKGIQEAQTIKIKVVEALLEKS